MILVNSVRDVLSLASGLSFAAGHGSPDGYVAPIRILTKADNLQPNQDVQIIELYDRMRPSLLIYLGGLGLALGEAEDIIHDSFLRLYDHLAAKTESKNLRGWIFRVAHNLAMDLFREGRRHPVVDNGMELLAAMLDSSFTPEEHALKNEEIRRVGSALLSLTQQQRAAVLLRAEDLRYHEIADILGISIKRVSELVQRALARLAGDL